MKKSRCFVREIWVSDPGSGPIGFGSKFRVVFVVSMCLELRYGAGPDKNRCWKTLYQWSTNECGNRGIGFLFWGSSHCANFKVRGPGPCNGKPNNKKHKHILAHLLVNHRVTNKSICWFLVILGLPINFG